MMKAQVFRGINQLSYEDVPIPTLEADEVLLKVEVVGLGGSDIKKICYPFYEPPRIFGHQITGSIAAIGDGVQDWSLGQRVAAIPHVPCLRCAYCLNDKFSLCKTYEDISTTAGFIPSGGGFSEYVKIPGHLVSHGGLLTIPDWVSFEEASFIYPISCCLKAIKKAKISVGQLVLVAGAKTRGLLLVALLKHFGARPMVTDANPLSLKKALEIGAEAVFETGDDDLHTKVNYRAEGLGVHACLLSESSEQAFYHAVDCTRKGGKILVFSEFSNYSISMNPNILYRREIDFLGSHGVDYKLQSLAMDILWNRRINVDLLMGDRYSLKELPEAMEQSTSAHCQPGKILIYPHEDPKENKV